MSELVALLYLAAHLLICTREANQAIAILG